MVTGNPSRGVLSKRRYDQAMPEAFVLRPLEETDLAAVAAIEDLAGMPACARWRRGARARRSSARAVVLEVGGEVVGVGSLWLAPDEAHITSLAVAGEARRRGHGRRLVRALVAGVARQRWAKAITLEVRASNAWAARALYRELRVRGGGGAARYYPDGEDAVIMTPASAGGTGG